MASVGDRIRRKVGEPIVVEFYITQEGVLQTGLAPVVSIFDETDVAFSSPAVSEPIAGLYRAAAFIPDAAGLWHARIVEATVPYEAWRAYDCAVQVLGDLIGSGGGSATCDIVEVVGV